jgi:hypothetical protein
MGNIKFLTDMAVNAAEPQKVEQLVTGYLRRKIQMWRNRFLLKSPNPID